MSPNDASKRTSGLIASLLVVAPLAASCARVGAQTAATAAVSNSIVIGVAGNCPAGAGPMRPAPAGDMADLNGDGYVCSMSIRSIAAETLRVTVDNDAPTPADAWVLPEPYIGM